MIDLRLFLSALWKHGELQLTGDLIAVVFLVWSQVNGRIPAKPFWALFIFAFFWAAFNAWRDEHRKVVSFGDAEQREERQRLRELARKMVEKYVDWTQMRHNSGPTALSELGLPASRSDKLIRTVIQEMAEQSNADPWSGHGKHIVGVDLMKFFTYVADKRINFSGTSVEDVVHAVKAQETHN